MAKGIARRGDLCHVICHDHLIDEEYNDARIEGGSIKVTCDRLDCARVGDTVIAPCGHRGKIITGSEKCSSDGLGMAVVGSLVGPGENNMEGEVIQGSEKSTTT